MQHLLLYLILFLFSTLNALAQNDQSAIKQLHSTIEKDSLYDTDLLPPSFHKGRREALRKLMPEKSVAVLFANPVRNRSNGVDFEYHQDPNFYYLTGYREPNALVFIFKENIEIDSIETNELIYVQPRNAKRETWDGKRLGIDGVKSKLEFEHAYANTHFADANINFSQFEQVLILPIEDDFRDDKNDRGDLFSLVKHFRQKTSANDVKVDKRKLFDMLASLRQTKLPEEITLLRKAINITCKAQNELMRALEPGMTEYQTEAILEYFFKKEGAEHCGFPSIQGAAENSCVLHYNTNRRKTQDGDMFVSDVGAEYHGYTADVTRTMPVNGKFSHEQKIIYNIVLEAQNAGIKACKAGNKFWEPHNEALKIIQKRLIELKIAKTPFEAMQYFPHGTSHYLGLDVHDAGLYGPLAPNQVITVEPGIYIPEGSPCDPKWWNIGIRIEDDILITNGEPENLSASSPRTIEEIEKLMKEPSLFNVIK
jgi:Xaa-Pro aminopeptidase